MSRSPVRTASRLWECRYIVPALSASFGLGRLEQVMGAWHEAPREVDVYLLGTDPGPNVKVRKRSGTIKAKVLLDRADDGYELWETRVDSTVPAPVLVWREALAPLGADAGAPVLAACAGADEIADLVGKGVAGLTGVTLEKSRRFFSRGSARLEVTEVSERATVVQSIAFESPELEDARRISSLFDLGDLGPPENYVGFCHRLVQPEPEP